MTTTGHHPQAQFQQSLVRERDRNGRRSLRPEWRETEIVRSVAGKTTLTI
jgi:hypothetical protein